MKDFLAIIVPYRNREEHLLQFVPYMINYLNKNLSCPYKIVVVEQANNEKFNRGTLINIGFDLIKDQSTYISPHDVDLLPEESDYSVPQNPTHLAAYRSQSDYVLEYEAFFGGVNLFLNEQFLKINGFSNVYCGYGAEDDDLVGRCHFSGLKVERRFGRYTSLPHNYDTVNNNDVVKNANYLHSFLRNGLKEAYLKTQKDGLSNLLYVIKNKKETNYTHYFVDFINETQ